MRRLLALGSCLLLVAACSDSDSKSSATSASTSVTASTAAVTSAPAQPAAAITPEVLCVANPGSGDGPQDYAFAYTSDATEPVVLDAAASSVANGQEADLVFVPVLFAPGRVSPAFFVSGDGSDTPPSWTIIGTDGVSRTATPDESTPQCVDDVTLLQRTPPDPRQPIVQVDDVSVNADGNVEFSTTLVGADTSACPDGLDAQPTAITWDDGNGNLITEGPTAQWTTGPLQPQYAATTPIAHVAVLVIDTCSYGDVSQTVWPGGVFDGLYTGVYICVVDDGGTLKASTSQDDSGCTGLPNTGGDRIRPS